MYIAHFEVKKQEPEKVYFSAKKQESKKIKFFAKEKEPIKFIISKDFRLEVQS